MASVVLLYAEGDADRARAISDASASVRPLLSPLSSDARAMAFGPQISVWLAWSRVAQDAGLGRVFSDIAAGHAGALLICACDDAPLPAALRDRTVVYDLEALRAADAAPARNARAAQPARPAEPREPGAARRASGAFAGGLMKGAAASVAFLGVGGAVALGAVDQLGAAGPRDAAAASAPEDMRVLSQVAAAPDIDWGEEEVAVAPVDQNELADVQNRLAAAAAQLDAMREATDPFVNQLDSWSRQDWRPSPAATAPLDRVADFSSPAPIEALPDLNTASVPALATPVSAPDDAELWNPEQGSSVI
ncbi:MAG: hypothetical protein GC189_06720 [Alphaproteobacteria bacterium]|nr:hypothetical protein [Alphaproteobacteria bacterium]